MANFKLFKNERGEEVAVNVDIAATVRLLAKKPDCVMFTFPSGETRTLLSGGQSLNSILSK